MKKLLLALFFIIGFSLTVAGGYGYYLTKTTVNLNQIARKFASSKVVKEYKESGIEVSATTNKNVLTIKYEDINYKYILNDSILSTSLKNDDLTGSIMLIAVVDSIGQLHGYHDGQTYATLNSEELKTYTIEKGIETTENGNTVNVKIDVNKKLKLVNMSNKYIEVADLKDLSDSIEGDGSAQTNKGNLIFYKTGSGNKAVITVGEKNKLTIDTYNTLSSAVEVICGNSGAILFAKDYPSLQDKSIGRYKMELNPKLSSMEAFIFNDSSYKIVRLTIDKSK
jgi:DNA-binding protein YbaB